MKSKLFSDRSVLQAYVETPLKDAVEEAARRDGTTLSEWVRRTLRGAVASQGAMPASPLPDRGERTDHVAA